MNTLATKANRILLGILFLFLAITLRLFYLSVPLHQEHVKRSRAPQTKQVIKRAERGTIRDRFNLPLAVNKLQYDVTILYSSIRNIPRVLWKEDHNGQKTKTYPRKNYISELSQKLSQELNESPESIEDLIHSRAALFHQLPFVIKKDVSEKTFFRLRMLERRWPGLQMQRSSRRHYPAGRVASHVVGYLGAINRNEYDSVLNEISDLQAYLEECRLGEWSEPPSNVRGPAEARHRLYDLEDRAYAIHDKIGKSGIEGKFEEALRGFHGRKNFYTDAIGNHLRELPGGVKALSGQRLLLTISKELQEFCENILIEQEEIRQGSCKKRDKITGEITSLKEPWIRGGAIVAMDPWTGEVIALASYPRFDPNDITNGEPSVDRWFETPRYLAKVWDGLLPLERERLAPSGEPTDHKQWLSWDHYLKTILPHQHPVTLLLHKMSLSESVQILDDFQTLLDVSSLAPRDLIRVLFPNSEGENSALSQNEVKRAQEKLADESSPWSFQFSSTRKFLSPLPLNYDRLLFLDLLRLHVDRDTFSEELPAIDLGQYHALRQKWSRFQHKLNSEVKTLYTKHTFQPWRKVHGKSYLRLKRKQEQEQGRYARPYLDHFIRMEKMMRKSFMSINHWPLVSLALEEPTAFKVPSDLAPYAIVLQQFQCNEKQELQQALSSYSKREQKALLRSFKDYDSLNLPLWGRYSHLRRGKEGQIQKHLASAFYPIYGFGCMRAQSFRQSTTQGSIFKLVVAYAALLEEWERLGKTVEKISLFEMIDHNQRRRGIVGFFLNGQPIPTLYKGGRLIGTLSNNVGKIDLPRALEVSSNPYFSLLAAETLQDPEKLNEVASLFSYGSKTGIELPGEISGRLPQDLKTNRSGLYAAAIGQHTLVVTPLQAAVMIGTIANGGKVMVPKIVRFSAGRLRERTSAPLFRKDRYLYQKSLELIGIDFPLFTTVEHATGKNKVNRYQPEVTRIIPMPPPIKTPLMEGMRRMMHHTATAGRVSLMKMYRNKPHMLRNFFKLENQLYGKSSTSESVERVDIDYKEGLQVFNHIWTGSFITSADPKDKEHSQIILRDRWGRPELVIVVYLKYGSYGGRAAPISAAVAKKWREIQHKHLSNKRTQEL